MNLTLLVDLDNTLITNEDSVFIPAYLDQLAQSIGHFPKEQVLKLLWQATGKMVSKNTPYGTLKSAFDEQFFPALGVDQEILSPVIDHFYNNIYPTLKPLTQPRSAAVEFINKAFSLGCQVVIATNPILPRVAIDHRLNWAGLSPDQYPFSLVTSYENMHFCKPHPEYLAEILAQIGWPNQPVVMVGNSLEDDILPAVKLGIPVFFLSNQPLPADLTLPAFSKQGSLDELIPWLSQLDSEKIQGEFSDLESKLAVLRAIPAALDTLTRQLDQAAFKFQPAPAEWSVTEVACHLRDVDREVNIPRFERILSDSNPFLPGIDTDLWAAERQYQLQSGPCAVKEFLTNRIGFISLLGTFSNVDWKRPVKHAIFGPSSAEELVGFIAAHDQNHIAQVKSVLQSLPHE